MSLLAHGRGTSLAEVFLLGLGFGDTLVEEGSIFGGRILGPLSITTLEGKTMTLVLKTLRGNETLDLWGLGIWLLSFTLWLNLTTDNELANIIILGETEELSDLCSALWTQTLGVNDVGDTGDIVLSLLDDGEGQDGKIHSDDAATDGLALSLSGTTRTIAGVTFRKKEANTGRVHDSLLHWETLLVVATSDLENVTLELITNRVTRNLSTHSLIHKNAQLALIFNLNQLLTAIGRLPQVSISILSVFATPGIRRRNVRRRC